MPIPQYICNPEFSLLLQAHMWHRCVDIVCENLKHAAAVGTDMVDPLGLLRYAFTPLIAYTADLPEQQMISCVSKNTSPVTMAIQSQFGDGKLYEPRDGQGTLTMLEELGRRIDPWKVQEFQEAAKALHLNELLHTCHKLFFDHILKWCKEVIGADEMDTRFCSQHKRIGTRHFGQGVSHVLQMTGREHWDIQCTIVATIAGVADPDFVRAIHAIVDFIYKAQSPTFTPTSIADMISSLQEFHEFKPAILSSLLHEGSVNPAVATRFQSCMLNVWNKFRLQLHSMLRPHLVMPSQQVQACLPSANYPHGNCDAVLLRIHGEGENPDATVAQVRMIFSLSKKGPPLSPELDQIFLYVQLFEVIAHPEDDPGVMMFHVKRRYMTDPGGTQVRVGMIIPLLDVTHAIELIPVYGDRADHAVTSSMCLERYDTFYLNNFSDKEWYIRKS
ncbi:hypothetical protein BDR07DRAFT_1485539 [Suillus spraguei]|nr:hypothetical protein BDR07DRAFT_1485539 [Suillus spraguei]